MNTTKKYLKKLIKIIKKPEMKVLPGHLSFFLVLSLIPIITIVGYVASLFNVSVDTVVNMMNVSLPNEVNNLLIPFITGSGMDFNIGFSVIVGYFVASNGAFSIIVCCNTLYKIDHDTYVKRRIKAMFLTILLVVLFVFTLFVLAFGNSILKFVLSFSIFTNISDKIYFVFLLLKWPLAVIFVFFMIKLIFTIAPDKNIRSKHTTKGAMFTSVAWLFSTFIYSYYVLNFSNYDIFYGSLSNIIIMMMWIYILSYSFVIGIAINVNSYNNEIVNKNSEIDNNNY